MTRRGQPNIISTGDAVWDQAQDEAARFLAPHVPVASPLAASDGSFVCMESLPVGDTGTHALHAVRMSQFLRGCTLDKAPQVRCGAAYSAPISQCRCQQQQQVSKLCSLLWQ